MPNSTKSIVVSLPKIDVGLSQSSHTAWLKGTLRCNFGTNWFRGKLGSVRHPPHWLSSKGPNYQRGVLFISAGAIEGHFERKTLQEDHKGGLVLARQCSGSPATCNPEESGLSGLPRSLLPTLFSGSCPVGLPPVPWTEKQLKDRHISSGAKSFLLRRPGWTDNILIFFLSGLQKLEQRV